MVTQRPVSPSHRPSVVDDALARADLLAFVVDSLGSIHGGAGGFMPVTPPTRARMASLARTAPARDDDRAVQRAIGAEVLASDLRRAIVLTITTRSTTVVRVQLGGIRSRALVCPLEGWADRVLVIVLPDYAASSWADLDHEEECDVREVLQQVRLQLEQHPASGNEVFAWSEDDPLETEVPAEIVLRTVALLLEAPRMIQRTDGTAVLTARREHEGGPVVLRMRVYGRTIHPSIVTALQTVHREFTATTGIPIEMVRRVTSLDVIATLDPGEAWRASARARRRDTGPPSAAAR